MKVHIYYFDEVVDPNSDVTTLPRWRSDESERGREGQGGAVRSLAAPRLL